MFGTGHGVPAPLIVSQRVSRDGTFATPSVLFPNKLDAVLESNPKSPFLTRDGRILLFQRKGQAGIELAFTHRVSQQGRWGPPGFMPAMNEAARGLPPTWPWTSDDGLLLIYCQGGDTQAEIWTARRTTKLEPFGDFRPLLVEGRPLRGRSPRYCAATGELFFSQNIGDRQWRLAVLKNFWPQGGPQAAASGTSGTAKFNRHEYKYFPEVLSWTAARAKCVALGGDLVVIESLAENTFVATLVEEAGGSECWIGATDEPAEAIWVSPSGERLSFLYWAKGQPNDKGAGEDYVLMTNRSFGGVPYGWQWCDQPNVTTQHQPGYVCEWSTPTSSSTSSDGWIELFNGRDLTGWQKMNGGAPNWRVENGYVQVAVGSGPIRTVKEFGPDFELSVEFWLPLMANNKGQTRANSGIFLIGRHELQIVDAFNNDVGGPDKTCGAIFGCVGVSASAIRPPETWQTFLVKYQAPRWDGAGQLDTFGRVSVTHNGVDVINDAALSTNGAGSVIPQRGSVGPIVLQDHGAAVRFRNLRIRPL